MSLFCKAIILITCHDSRWRIFQFSRVNHHTEGYLSKGIVKRTGRRESIEPKKRYKQISSMDLILSNYWWESLVEVIRQNIAGWCQQIFLSSLTMHSNVLLLSLKQTFPCIIWILTEGDGIKTRQPFKIFSTFQVHTFLHDLLSSEFFRNLVSVCHCFRQTRLNNPGKALVAPKLKWQIQVPNR